MILESKMLSRLNAIDDKIRAIDGLLSGFERRLAKIEAIERKGENWEERLSIALDRFKRRVSLAYEDLIKENGHSQIDGFEVFLRIVSRERDYLVEEAQRYFETR